MPPLPNSLPRIFSCTDPHRVLSDSPNHLGRSSEGKHQMDVGSNPGSISSCHITFQSLSPFICKMG